MGRYIRYPLLTRLNRGAPFEISLCNQTTMPFCRECGKEVQEDWISCPYCAATIGEPAIISIQDSAVIGDVSINDSQAISNAMKESSKCVSCGSIGAVQITCRECGKMACCSVCKEDIDNKI